MSNAKLEICRQAKLLFIEKGYNNVSLRDIAKAVGIDISNSTYYFPQKKTLSLRYKKNYVLIL